jgi:iron uptake system component EfeO
VLQANVDGAMEVVSLLSPFLDKKDPGLLATISKQNAAVTKAMAPLKASPGYDGTGYIEYSAISDSQKKHLSGAINALAEDLSKLSLPVSS